MLISTDRGQVADREQEAEKRTQVSMETDQPSSTGRHTLTHPACAAGTTSMPGPALDCGPPLAFQSCPRVWMPHWVTAPPGTGFGSLSTAGHWASHAAQVMFQQESKQMEKN